MISGKSLLKAFRLYCNCRGKTYLNVIIFTFLFTVAIDALAQIKKPNLQNDTIKQGLGFILNHSKLNNVNIGIIVQSMKTNHILYQHRVNYFYTPASVQKLFTAVAALSFLKPSYRFMTQLFMDGKIKNGTLQGNLTVKFSGDPELKLKDLRELFHQLHRYGLNKIVGNVYIDNFDYSNIPQYPPGCLWDDLSYSYAAPLNTIIINHNKFLLHFFPGKTNGEKPKLKSNLPPNVARFYNYLQTSAKYNKYCPITIYSNDQNDYKLGGCLVKSWGEQRRVLAIRDMIGYSKAIIKQLLKRNQIEYAGHINIHRIPPNAVLIANHLSPPLSKIVKEMLKDSDNLSTNSVLKKIGEVYDQNQSTWIKSLHALKTILQTPTGIDFKNNLIADGAGLSRYNLITPQQIAKLLYYAYHNPTINPTLLAALPIGGKDGTLEDRMLSTSKQERVRAKTGSMTGVSALAGYIQTKHNGTLSFVIMINGFIGKNKPYIQLEDQICEFIINAR